MNIADSILVVDDDPVVRRLIAACLEKAGYRVAQTEDAEGLRAWAAADPPDLVILDIGLPDGDGLALARDLRARSDLGIIMVTERGTPDERALGIEVGADDYLAKPVYPRELLARVKAVLDRRAGTVRAAGRLRFADWLFEPGKRRVCDASGTAVPLTPAEFDLLEVLIRRAGRIQSREALMAALGTEDDESGLRSVDILVSRLRKKLGAPLIETCRGHGYRFAAPLEKG